MVHRSIADEFVNRLTTELAKLKVGMPWEKVSLLRRYQVCIVQPT